MLWSIKSLRGYVIDATDGEIGKTEGFLVDTQHWILSYVIVKTGKWLLGRQVLLSPIAFHQPDWASHRFPVELTQEQVKNSPAFIHEQPISRQYQKELHDYYAWPYYWAMKSSLHPVPIPPVSPEKSINSECAAHKEQNSHLRSTQEVIGYHIQATDDEVGHVEDFIVEDELWMIRYIVIDTKNWGPGKKFLVSPANIQHVAWEKKKVYMRLSTQQIQEGLEYNPSEPVNRQYEVRFYDYYGRPKYRKHP